MELKQNTGIKNSWANYFSSIVLVYSKEKQRKISPTEKVAK
jgi:hypothetical protein